VSKKSSLRSRDEIIANSKFSSKKVFLEEVGVSLTDAFREDRKGDRTNLAGSGLYAKDVAKYKCRMKYPLGKTRKLHMMKIMDENPRFHQKSYIKQVLKTKNVVKCNKENLARSKDDLKSDFYKPYLPLTLAESLIKSETVREYKDYNPLGIYSETTENYLKGIGGLESEKDAEILEDDEIQRKRMEYNTKLRETPNDVALWIEFIDFQDEALQETNFQPNADKKESKKSRKEKCRIIRAKALTERKLAICKSAIEKNSRSIELAVKRLELSRHLFDDPKILDQQWKELVYVYPENVSLWKSYLLFMQTHNPFSILDAVKAYRGCIFKLRKQQEKKIEDGECVVKILEIEHGIIDIIESGVLMLVQAGYSEKAVSVYQGLLELNLFSPDFQGGYSVDDKLSLFEPIWDSGVSKVGQAGARGWGTELQERIGEGRGDIDEFGVKKEDWEEKLIEEGGEKGQTWIKVEIGREKEQFFPWRKGEEEPDDPERIVEFDTINGFLAQFSREETKFRVLLSLLRLLGWQELNQEYANLISSGASAFYLNTTALNKQDYSGDDIKVLQSILPNFMTQESLAIFVHFIFAQTYNKFSEPFRTKIISLWLDFECEVVRSSSADKSLKKDLRKLVKSLLKEDRNNIELVVKYAEIEYQLSGYQAAHSIIETSLTTANKSVLSQKFEENIVASCLLYRAGVELELREICRIKIDNQIDDGMNKDRLQWLLVGVGSGLAFKPLTNDNKMTMLALVDGSKQNLEMWISENLDNIRDINFFKLAPFAKHSLVEIIFIYAWLVNFTSGWEDSVAALNGFVKQIQSKTRKKGRFVEEYLTLKFIEESIDKICYDLLWYESVQDIKMKQALRSFYITCLEKYPNSAYFLNKLGCVEGSTSVVSSVWRTVCKVIQNKTLVNFNLVEEVTKLGLTKFVKVLDPDNPGELPVIGLGFLNKLQNLLEILISLPNIRHSPLVWRLLLWTTSVLSSGAHSTEAREALKTLLYRSIQDVPWCKGLYLDTTLYLDKIGELFTTFKQEIVIGGEYAASEDVEDEFVEPKFEEKIGTLEHVTELMVEKDLRVRLPLQELDVLLDPV